ncbi:hypothetical protein M2351_000938 [Azospirillum canadense]|nr:hypothetical protein [Azospirillum canadense]
MPSCHGGWAVEGRAKVDPIGPYTVPGGTQPS